MTPCSVPELNVGEGRPYNYSRLYSPTYSSASWAYRVFGSPPVDLRDTLLDLTPYTYYNALFLSAHGPMLGSPAKSIHVHSR